MNTPDPKSPAASGPAAEPPEDRALRIERRARRRERAAAECAESRDHEGAAEEAAEAAKAWGAAADSWEAAGRVALAGFAHLRNGRWEAEAAEHRKLLARAQAAEPGGGAPAPG